MGHGYDLYTLQEELKFVNSDRSKWGKVLDSLDELRNTFPASADLAEICAGETQSEHVLPGFTRYRQKNTAQKSSSFDNIAYECHACDKFILGPPRVESFYNIRHLSGSAGFKYNCGNCESTLASIDLEFS